MPTTIETSNPACAQNPRISVVNASATTICLCPPKRRTSRPLDGSQ